MGMLDGITGSLGDLADAASDTVQSAGSAAAGAIDAAAQAASEALGTAAGDAAQAPAAATDSGAAEHAARAHASDPGARTLEDRLRSLGPNAASYLGWFPDTKPPDAVSIGDRFYAPEDTPVARLGRSAADLEKAAIDLRGDRASLLAAASKVTQLGDDPETSWQSEGCASACLVANSLTQGQEGMLGLIQTIRQRGENAAQPNPPYKGWKSQPVSGFKELDEIESRVRAGTITEKDLQSLQRLVHIQMRGLENDSATKVDKSPAININVLQTYVNGGGEGRFSDPSPLKGQLANADVRLVDTGRSRHYVLTTTDEGGRPVVYDPWPRAGGRGQVERDPAEVGRYKGNAHYSYQTTDKYWFDIDGDPTA